MTTGDLDGDPDTVSKQTELVEFVAFTQPFVDKIDWRTSGCLLMSCFRVRVHVTPVLQGYHDQDARDINAGGDPVAARD